MKYLGLATNRLFLLLEYWLGHDVVVSGGWACTTYVLTINVYEDSQLYDFRNMGPQLTSNV